MADQAASRAAQVETKSPVNQELFRVLVESVKDYAIFVLSPDGHVLTWNLGAQALKGYERDEIVGHHFSKFYLPEAIQSNWPARELELAEKEGRFTDEGWRVKKDGTSFWASVTITALRDSTGKLTGFAKVTQDIERSPGSGRAHPEFEPRAAHPDRPTGRIATNH